MQRLRFFFAVLLSARALAGACCNGASVLPALITGDEQISLGVSFAQQMVIGDAPVQGPAVFRAAGDNESAQILRIEGAFLLSDRWQAGLSLPLARHARSVGSLNENSVGLGDTGITVGFEALPEREYSVWKPRGYIFAQATLPTGRSIYEATLPLGMDARGSGFYTLGLGATLLKIWGDWDSSLFFEVHHGLARSFSPADGSNLRVIPGFGVTASAAAGWSFVPRWRVGLSLTPQWEGARRSEGSIVSAGSGQLRWNTALNLGYQINDELNVALSYVDQTLMGPAYNALLARSFIFSLQQRWPR